LRSNTLIRHLNSVFIPLFMLKITEKRGPYFWGLWLWRTKKVHSPHQISIKKFFAFWRTRNFFGKSWYSVKLGLTVFWSLNVLFKYSFGYLISNSN
jgi:hypothetical protein